MHVTSHMKTRMNHRAITRGVVDLTLELGEDEGDKTQLTPRRARRLAAELRAELKLLERIIAKGGVTVVSQDATLITTYANGRADRRRARQGNRLVAA